MANEPPSPRQLIGIGTGLVGCIVLGLVAGLLLDAAMHTSPLFTAIGLLLGIVGATATMIVQFRTFMRD
ncbi:AtpZ/AtpI family protein [Antrihabitans spumae]|uniref:AtpZ/AtpI family protein n=1 Tax=Antrihabitans spumae TaxID=3373370 RepID=A0ABW7KEB0_9NOCA